MNDLPLMNHPLDEPTAFRPEDLVEAVRQQRGKGNGSIPPLGVLEFDGDLTDKLIARGQVRRCEDWPCFHTDMWLWPKDEPRCGIVARTIGGPYTVLIAEQMAVCGMKAVVGLASAGRIGQRHARMKALIRKAEKQLTRRRFIETADLTGKVYASLIRHLEDRGVLPHRPFHAAVCQGAALRNISGKAIAWFIQRARVERQLALSPKTSPKNALTSLNLLADGKPTRAAVLLFGNDPQKFLPSAELKCLHFHGTTVVKPIPSYKVFKGTLFEQVDEAVDFVMSKVHRAVGTRAAGPAAPVDYEIPRHVVAEAIVNAVAHRDYASAAAIQVYVFADRFEIWNPGELPPSLTPESLRQQHPSLPRNPLIAEALFLAHYIEKVGTGTLDVIAGCQSAELPEPEFLQEGDQFVLRIWRDWLTVEALAGLDLNDRQSQAMQTIKVERQITTMAYQKLVGCAKRTAVRDLDDMIDKGILRREGAGRGAHYVLVEKRASNVPIMPSPDADANRARNVPIVPSSAKQTGSETAQSAQAKQRPRKRKGTAKRQSSRRKKDDKE